MNEFYGTSANGGVLLLRTGGSIAFRPRTTALRVGDIDIIDEVLVHDVYGIDDLVLSVGGILDIGAHIGIFTIAAGYRFKSARVVAIEPEENNFALLTENIARNPNIDIRAVKAALGLGRGERKIAISELNTGGHSLLVDAGPGLDWPTCRTITANDAIALCAGDASLVKVDCEGGEEALLGRRAARLWAGTKAMVFETHGPVLAKRIVDQLERHGYRVCLLAKSVGSEGEFCIYRAVGVEGAIRDDR